MCFRELYHKLYNWLNPASLSHQDAILVRFYEGEFNETGGTLGDKDWPVA